MFGFCPGNHDFTSSGGSGQPYIPQTHIDYLRTSRITFGNALGPQFERQ